MRYLTQWQPWSNVPIACANGLVDAERQMRVYRRLQTKRLACSLSTLPFH